MPSTNDIGNRGENIFNVRITQDFLFRPSFLGEKWPAGDHYIEINDDLKPYPFIVQTKTTTTGYLQNGNLKAKVPNNKLTKLMNIPIPTFVAGVDEDKEMVFLCPSYHNVTFPSIPTNKIILDVSNKPQSLVNLQKLKDDIINYWENSGIINYKQNYISTI